MENEVNNEVVENVNDTTDYKALYEASKTDLEAKGNKVTELEWLIQKHKKTPKVDKKPENEPSNFWKEDVQKMLDDNQFYTANPWMLEHKEALEKFTSNGLSNADAMTLVLANDTTIQARENTSNSNFTNWESWGGKKTYTQEQLQKLPHSEKMQALRDISSWKATETL